MELTPDNKIRKFILVGDKVLLKPSAFSEKTKSGLYLPQTVIEKEPVQSGYVLQVGPGYAIPSMEETESWKGEEARIQYIPLQAKEGDLALFLARQSFEVQYEGEKYLIIPHQAILMLVREDDLF
ncbi:MAG TPA: co-chaperone GroES family protein [Catalimonadaceae bacterium]|nr:co-chaperone GroES family protein [Catalimonadaceae bacterium]